MPAENMLDVLRGFLLMHRRCEKPVEPSKQIELFQKLARENPEPNTAPQHMSYAEPPDYRPMPGIDASTDEPAPEIDPPRPCALFDRMYPLATTTETLNSALCHALPNGQWIALNLNEVAQWHPASGIFNAIANWARIEKAHAEAGSREPIAGLAIPARTPMPEKLAELLGVKPKVKRGARPLTSPPKKKIKVTKEQQ